MRAMSIVERGNESRELGAGEATELPDGGDT